MRRKVPLWPGLSDRNRRRYVFSLLERGIAIDRATRRTIARRFGCSEQTVYTDMVAYRANSDDRALLYTYRRRFTNHQARVRRLGLPDLLTWEDFIERMKSTAGRCFYCQKQVGYALLTPDHIIPLSRGGHHTADNIVPACVSCNLGKGNRCNR